MSADTRIEWADRTWNPLLGCERVSAGCDGCYAISTARIRAGHPNPKIADAFAGLTHRQDGRIDWTGHVNLLPGRLGEPLTWRKPRKVFVNSQSDLFHKDVPDDFIAQVFAVMALTPQHTYQLLTKRHGRMRALLSKTVQDSDALVWRVKEAMWGLAGRSPAAAAARRALPMAEWWPLRNLWLGVSVEDQRHADMRIPALIDTPAAVRWLSCEPLLGPIDLNRTDKDVLVDGGIDWVVVGGESGPKARPMLPDWARQLRDQVTAARVPFFFKQWGEWAPMVAGVNPGREIRAYPSALIQRVGKNRAGRELDGQTWDEYPSVVTG